jgi:hypothetical protein
MIKLYFDEDVPEAVAIALKLRGYDVLTVREALKKGLSDIDQFKAASSEERALFTHNTADFSMLHKEFTNNGWQHRGIIVSKQWPIGVIVNALLRLLSTLTPEIAANQIFWLSDWISRE